MRTAGQLLGFFVSLLGVGIARVVPKAGAAVAYWGVGIVERNG